MANKLITNFKSYFLNKNSGKINFKIIKSRFNERWYRDTYFRVKVFIGIFSSCIRINQFN